MQKQTPQDIAALFGPSTATGTISATGSSLYRRGTHVLLVFGRPRLFLESRSVDLNRYRDARVVVRGALSPNTHEKFLPVLTVESVQLIGEPAPPPLQRYSVEALKFSLEAPRSWLQEIAGGSLTFRLPSETAPFIRIGTMDIPKPPEGLRVRIDGRSGVRTVDAGGVHNVFIERGDDGSPPRSRPSAPRPNLPARTEQRSGGPDLTVVRAGGSAERALGINSGLLLFTFAPKGEESALLRDAFYTMLRSVRFQAQPFVAADQEPFAAAGEGNVEGSKQPCGGPAAVICPTEEYCEVKELDTGIGVCRQLR